MSEEIKDILENQGPAGTRPTKAGAAKARIDEEKHLAETMDWNTLYKEIGKRKTQIEQLKEDINGLERKQGIIKTEINKYERILKHKRARFKA